MIIIDYHHWTANGDWAFDPVQFFTVSSAFCITFLTHFSAFSSSSAELFTFSQRSSSRFLSTFLPHLSDVSHVALLSSDLSSRFAHQTAWPTPKAMTAELKAHNTATMVSVWPSVEKASKNYKALEMEGLLSRTESGVPFVVSNQGAQSQPDAYEYDPFMTEGRAFMAAQIKTNYLENGVSSFWFVILRVCFVCAFR